jgi:hypothetical protein
MLQCLTVDGEAAPFSIGNGRHLCLEEGKRECNAKGNAREFGGKHSHPRSSIVEQRRRIDSSNFHATVVCIWRV